MAFYQQKSTVVIFIAGLVLVMTAIKSVNAAAHLFKAENFESGCPNTQAEFIEAKGKVLQEIGPLIENLFETQLPTTNETTSTTTTSNTDATTTEESITDVNPCNSSEWRQVVFINMSDTSQNCPSGLSLTSHSKRTCGHSTLGPCSSTTFGVGDDAYSQVCGRIIAYQVGSTSAFRSYIDRVKFVGIEDGYVDGVILTRGYVGRRQYIWTFAAGLTEVYTDGFLNEVCPCDTSNNTVASPPFVGNDYFCESGLYSLWSNDYYRTLFSDDPLWDGQNCTSNSTCCQFNNPPWFIKNLTNSTNENTEFRICSDGAINFDDIFIELIELYVQ